MVWVDTYPGEQPGEQADGVASAEGPGRGASLAGLLRSGERGTNSCCCQLLNVSHASDDFGLSCGVEVRSRSRMGGRVVLSTSEYAFAS